MSFDQPRMEGQVIMLSLREQNTRAREVSASTGIPVDNISVGMDGSVRAFLMNLRLDGFRMIIRDEWVEIDPDTFHDYHNNGE